MGYAFFAPLALPLETVMLPICAGDLFGDRAYNRVLGLFVSVNTAGYAVGAPLTNLCYDLLGSYKPIIYFFAGIMPVTTLVMYLIISATKRERAALAAAAETPTGVTV